jgi:hypothetical protein
MIVHDIVCEIGGEISRMHGFRHRMHRWGRRSGCGGPFWVTTVPRHRDEIIDLIVKAA